MTAGRAPVAPTASTPAAATAAATSAVGEATTTVALFDLDRTLLPGSSLEVLGRALAAEGLVTRRRLARAAVQQLRFTTFGASDATATRMCTEGLGVVAGVERRRLLPLVHRVGRELAATPSAAIRERLARHLDAGHFCVILSAAPQELVEVIGTHLGTHRAVGTCAEVVDGAFTGALRGPFCYGPGKLVRLRQALGSIDLGQAWAYADSGSDVPLLSAVGHPVAVNPDRRLRRVATDHAWETLAT